MKKPIRSLIILCGAAALALLPACQTTATKCAKCGTANCTQCDTTAAKACPKCGKVGCTTCKM